jgi:CRISPR-associated protein Csm2
MSDYRKQLKQLKEPEFLKKDADYVSIAEKTMEGLRFKNRRGELGFGDLSTSKIRNILTMVNEIYNEIVLEKEDTLSSYYIDKIRYMKVRLVYEAGRDEKRAIKNFIEKAELITALDYIGDSKEKFLRYARYLESLVAYHRFLGGRPD